jgi:hypothetical protein
MNPTTQDRDLLCIEPTIFLGGGFASRTRIAGNDGQLSSTAFTAPTADFIQAGLAAGMVLCTWADAPEEPSSLEIVSVDTATSLTVSVLRESPDGEPIAPPAGASLGFFVRSYRPEIVRASQELAALLSRDGEARRQDVPAFLDAADLRETVAAGALAKIYAARTEGAAEGDAEWIKARHYRRVWEAARSRLRVAVDTDGDGLADETRTLSHVTLRRI